ncbi:SDR family oxidoreductase [Thiohalobacter thiocyanaticus]|uniref:SDR family oxidoreductase n=1 Tax=Thiohalobacter thiocyanaticus TaxID=585455 RepID=A0A426QJC1_9GAMM|nr:SDR family oxidoreductase [Thiohalobacter thiocyanaticus]RRQ21859.1 SDR family oxidoreductase [Thiohalobacter thiocyanaticus]
MRQYHLERVLVVGCGYVGRRLGRQLRTGDVPVTGLVRSDASAAALRGVDIAPLQLDLDQALPAGALPAAGRELYYFAPPPPEGDGDPRLARVLEQLQPGNLPRRIVYISTSGVYGDSGGDWIDESFPLNPGTPRGRRRLAAEQALQAWSEQTGVAVVILRVPGIYGPGKLPLERIRQGLPILREEDCPYTNRIQVDDLISACCAAMERGEPGAAYNVADGHPSTMADYFACIAKAAGLPPPPTVTRAEAPEKLSRGMQAFMNESKRLDNRRLREELGVELQYPDLEAGLAACFAEEAK